jgi:hypothetical protein
MFILREGVWACAHANRTIARNPVRIHGWARSCPVDGVGAKAESLGTAFTHKVHGILILKSVTPASLARSYRGCNVWARGGLPWNLRRCQGLGWIVGMLLCLKRTNIGLSSNTHISHIIWLRGFTYCLKISLVWSRCHVYWRRVLSVIYQDLYIRVCTVCASVCMYACICQ